MADENATLNAPESSLGELVKAGDLTSTLELTSTAEGPEPDDPQESEKGTEEGKPGEPPFHEHPRWKEVLAEKNELKARTQALEEQIAALKKEPVKETPAYRDLTSMTPQEILDWQAEDPVGWAANLVQQAKHEISRELSQQSDSRAEQERVEKTYTEYARKHSDFNDMWESGEIPKFLRDNPGHNAMSAHQVLTRDKEIAAVREQAAREAEEKARKNLYTKQKAGVLSGGPQGGRAPGADPALKNPNAYGGVNAVLVARLRARRAGG